MRLSRAVVIAFRTVNNPRMFQPAKGLTLRLDMRAPMGEITEKALRRGCHA
jgi:hypothetical protein